MKNERYGIIDKDFKCIVEPQYVSYDGFHNGFAFFQKDNTKSYDVSQDQIELEAANLFPFEKKKEKFDIIDTVGNIVYTDVTRLDNGFCIVTAPSVFQKWELEGGSFFEFHPLCSVLSQPRRNITDPTSAPPLEGRGAAAH